MKKTSLSDLGGLVYSSDQGRMCPGCAKPVTACICKQLSQPSISGNGAVRVGRETAGRKGSGVTTVQGLPLDQEHLEDLARKLKARCGCGGTVKNGVIEIQGEHRDTLVLELTKLGYPAKRAGG